MTRGAKSRDALAVLVISIVIVSGILVAILPIVFRPHFGCGGAVSHFSMPACVQQTSDGGYVVLGNRALVAVRCTQEFLNMASRIGSMAENGSILLIKTDLYGSIQWNKPYGGEHGCWAETVQQTADEGYVILATLDSEIGLIKVDSNGNIQWDKKFGAMGPELPTSVMQSVDGGYIIAATSPSDGAGHMDFRLTKTDSAGNMQWNRTYGDLAAFRRTTSLDMTSDGGYLIAGFAYLGYRAFQLIKTDRNGIMQWNATYPLGQSNDLVFAFESSDGAYVMAGSVWNGTSDSSRRDYWLKKADSNLTVQWSKAYGGSQSEWLYSARKTADGGYFLAGRRLPDYGVDTYVWLVKTDQYGNATWSRTHLTNGTITDCPVCPTSDGGYVIAQWGSFNADQMQLVKADAYGFVEWDEMLEFPS